MLSWAGTIERNSDLTSPSVTRAYTSVYFGIGILLHWQTNKFVFATYFVLSQVSPTWAHLFFAVRTPTLNVHEFALNSNDTAAVFEPIVCTACGQVHLINAKTGEVLDRDIELRASQSRFKARWSGDRFLR